MDKMLRSMEAARRENGELRRRLVESSELLARLKGLPEPDALSLLQRLRLASRPASGLTGLAVEALDSDMAEENEQTAPPPQSSLEFELMIRHPIAYPTLCHLDQYPQPVPREQEQSLSSSFETRLVHLATFFSLITYLIPPVFSFSLQDSL